MKFYKTELKGIIAVLLSVLIWASSFVVMKVAIGGFGAMNVIFYRLLFGSIFFIFFYKHFINKTYTKKDIILILAMAFFEPVLYFIFEINALAFTSASQAGVISAVMPITTIFVARVFLKEDINQKMILGSAIAIIGTIWLSAESEVKAYAPNPILGNFLEFMAMFCSAFYAIIIRHLSQKYSAIFLTAAQTFIGTIAFLPLVLAEGISFDFSLSLFFYILYLGIVVSAFGYGLFNYALSQMPASKATIFINLVPVFSVILAFLILDERLNFTQILASLLILVGVFITQKKPRKSFY